MIPPAAASDRGAKQPQQIDRRNGSEWTEDELWSRQRQAATLVQPKGSLKRTKMKYEKWNKNAEHTSRPLTLVWSRCCRRRRHRRRRHSGELVRRSHRWKVRSCDARQLPYTHIRIDIIVAVSAVASPAAAAAATETTTTAMQFAAIRPLERPSHWPYLQRKACPYYRRLMYAWNSCNDNDLGSAKRQPNRHSRRRQDCKRPRTARYKCVWLRMFGHTEHRQMNLTADGRTKKAERGKRHHDDNERTEKEMRKTRTRDPQQKERMKEPDVGIVSSASRTSLLCGIITPASLSKRHY